jgi:hypothetical protein
MSEPELHGRGLDGTPVRNLKGVLGKRFTYPPFSVLNAREGWWQARKRAWIKLGIQSELGRGGNLLNLSDGCEEYRQNAGRYGKQMAPGGGGDLRTSAYLPGGGGTRPGSVMSAERRRKHTASLKGGLAFGLTMQPYEEQRGGPRRNKNPGPRLDGTNVPRGEVEISAANAGTSIFDPVLCELAYRWFSPPGGDVLDPFAGGSVRGIVAGMLGRHYVGIDLSQAQVTHNHAQADELFPEGAADFRPDWVVGDSGDTLARPPNIGRYDAMLTCPPYGDLEQYSDDPRDLSNMDYPTFRRRYAEIVGLACARLNLNRFACVVVGDFRDRAGNFNNFVGDTITAFLACGLKLYNQAVLVTAVGSLSVRVARQFTASRKLGMSHQHLLIFVKGDGRAAAAACAGEDA